MKEELPSVLTDQIILSTDLNTLLSEAYQSYYQHVFVTRGHLVCLVGDRVHEVNSGEGIILIEGKPIMLVECSDDVEVQGLLLSRKYIYMYQPKIKFNIKGLPFYYQNPVMSMSVQQMQMCLDDLKQIAFRLDLPDHLYHFDTLKRAIDIFTFDIFDIYTKCNNEQAAQGGQKAIVSQKFIRLAQDNVRTERSVKYYAEVLHVTAKYLSKACIFTTGHNASYWIAEFAVMQILEQLMQTDKTITEISDEFHFQNLSHFNRFIKTHTGLSPTALRKK